MPSQQPIATAHTGRLSADTPGTHDRSGASDTSVTTDADARRTPDRPQTAQDGQPASAIARRIVTLLTANRYQHRDETQLQELIAEVLAGVGYTATREVGLSPASRIDLVVEPRIGIEVKVAGSVVDVAGQIQRYARTGDLDALVLVTTRAEHTALPARLGGLPVLVAHLPPALA